MIGVYAANQSRVTMPNWTRSVKDAPSAFAEPLGARVGQHDDPHPGGRNHRVMGPGPQCESTAASFISVSINSTEPM